MSALKLALLNLSRRKIPTFITIFAISISVACSGILLRLNYLSQSRFETLAQGPEAIIGAKSGGIEILLSALNSEGDYPGFLPFKLFESLRNQTNVQFEDGKSSQGSFIQSIIPMLYVGKYSQYKVIATDEEILQEVALEEGHWPHSYGEVLVGDEVARMRGVKLGDKLSAQLWISQKNVSETIDLKVTGILKSKGSNWDRLIYTNLLTGKNLMKLLPPQERSIWGEDVLNYFLVYLKGDSFEQMAELINHRTVGQGVSVSREKKRLATLTGTSKQIGLFVTGLVLFLGALSVSSMHMSRFEGVSMQMAILRALGFRRRFIGKFLLYEGVILGVISIIIGGALDYVGFPIVRGLISTSLPDSAVTGVGLLRSYPIWGVTLLATTLSVIFPFIRIYRQDVNSALRS